MFIWIICLTKCLLPCYFRLVSWKDVPIWTIYSYLSNLITWLKLAKRIYCCATIKYSFFLFFCAFFKKYFSKNIFFFLMRIIILYIIIMRLIKNTIWIVITIWIFISYSSCLTNLWALIHTYTLRTWRSIRADNTIATSTISIWSLTCYQENSFMKTTNNWYFRLLLLLLNLLLSILCLLSWIISCRLWLLCRLLWIQLRILVICTSLSLLLLRTLIIFRR